MIVYRSTKDGFTSDVDGGNIDAIILENFKAKLKHSTSHREVQSWWNSLNYMARVLGDDHIPGDAGVAIECQIPLTSKRIDFILSGTDAAQQPQVVIVELKQWTKAERTDKSGIVRTALGQGLHETSHPSYQAWSYAAMLEDFSETVRDEGIRLNPCAYLHNYGEDDVIRHPFYGEYLDKAPVFLKTEMLQLRDFIKRFVRHGDQGQIMYRIDQGKIKPSRQLADALSGMLRGNREFVLLDEQKLVYESALHLAHQAETRGKQVMIVQGGPGTGKSVVAINLLVELTRREKMVHYVSKNSAPREVFKAKLTGTLSPTRVQAMFKGSGAYVEAPAGQMDVLVVDEAHRLNEKSGLYGNQGENQIKEIIQTAACSVFFVDDHQQVTLKDIGSTQSIRHWARLAGATVHDFELPSQFRCNGSDGYVAMIDDLLQIRPTAQSDLEGLDYDFRVVDSPNELRDLIRERNLQDNKSRLVAGYCWDWKSKKDPQAMDIVLPEFGFGMKWNLSEDGPAWIIRPDSIDQIGCIHTCQGLEASYIGVIIGPDLVVRNGKVLGDPSKRSSMDRSIRGYKQVLRDQPIEGALRLTQIIQNTYRTLLTRGIKGCYVYCTDPETQAHFRARVGG